MVINHMTEDADQARDMKQDPLHDGHQEPIVETLPALSTPLPLLGWRGGRRGHLLGRATLQRVGSSTCQRLRISLRKKISLLYSNVLLSRDNQFTILPEVHLNRERS